MSLFGLQIVSRALTFALNIAIARTVDRRIPLLTPPPFLSPDSHLSSNFSPSFPLSPLSSPHKHHRPPPPHPTYRKPPHTQRCHFSFVKHYLNCRESLGRGAVQLQLITDAILTLSREGFRDAMQRTPASDWNASPSRERLLRVAWLSVPLSALVAVAVIMSGSASGALEAQGAAAAALLFALAALVEMVLLPYMLQGLGFGVLEFGFFSVEGLGFLGSGFAFSTQQKMAISSSLPFFSLLHFFLAYMVASRLVSLILSSFSLPPSLPLHPSSHIQLAEPLYIMAHNLLLIHVRVRVEVRCLFLLGQSLSKNLAFRWLSHIVGPSTSGPKMEPLNTKSRLHGS